jgi:hypothetical protein
MQQKGASHLDLFTPACRTHLGTASTQGRATDTALLLTNPLRALPVSAAIAAPEGQPRCYWGRSRGSQS